MMNPDEFKKFLIRQEELYKSSSKKGISYIAGVLTIIQIDLDVLMLLSKNKLSSTKDNDWDWNNRVWPTYFKHIKRSCLIDLWAVTEIRIREIAEEKALDIKGRYDAIKTLIAEARKINKSSQVEKLLKRAESKLGGKFIEFPSYLSAVLQRSTFNTKERKDWRECFDLFRIMRNSVHDNFTCTETRSLQCYGYRKDFTKGKPINVQFDDLEKIIEKLLDFFEAIES